VIARRPCLKATPDHPTRAVQECGMPDRRRQGFAIVELLVAVEIVAAVHAALGWAGVGSRRSSGHSETASMLRERQRTFVLARATAHSICPRCVSR
jgi:hypothetical protein